MTHQEHSSSCFQGSFVFIHGDAEGSCHSAAANLSWQICSQFALRRLKSRRNRRNGPSTPHPNEAGAAPASAADCCSNSCNALTTRQSAGFCPSLAYPQEPPPLPPYAIRPFICVQRLQDATAGLQVAGARLQANQRRCSRPQLGGIGLDAAASVLSVFRVR